MGRPLPILHWPLCRRTCRFLRCCLHRRSAHKTHLTARPAQSAREGAAGRATHLAPASVSQRLELPHRRPHPTSMRSRALMPAQRPATSTPVAPLRLRELRRVTKLGCRALRLVTPPYRSGVQPVRKPAWAAPATPWPSPLAVTPCSSAPSRRRRMPRAAPRRPARSSCPPPAARRSARSAMSSAGRREQRWSATKWVPSSLPSAYSRRHFPEHENECVTGRSACKRRNAPELPRSASTCRAGRPNVHAIQRRCLRDAIHALSYNLLQARRPNQIRV